MLSGRDRYGSDNQRSGGNGHSHSMGGGGGGGGRGGGYRLIVTGFDSMTSWQDLKDFGRTVGKSVVFVDVYTRRGNKEGIIEYHDYEDYKHGLRYLDKARLNGGRVRVYAERGDDGGSDGQKGNKSDNYEDSDYDKKQRMKREKREREKRERERMSRICPTSPLMPPSYIFVMGGGHPLSPHSPIND